MTQDFLGKYYPEVKRKLHEQRIKKLEKILKDTKTEYNELYGDKTNF